MQFGAQWLRHIVADDRYAGSAPPAAPSARVLLSVKGAESRWGEGAETKSVGACVSG